MCKHLDNVYISTEYIYEVLFIFFCFSHSVDALVEESGCSLENLATTKFRMCVIAGNWKQVNGNSS